jgi:predicted amidohydrolase
MKVSFLQMNVRKGDIHGNLRFIQESLDGAKTDLVVLPELCFCGYVFPDRQALLPYSTPDQIETIVTALTVLCRKNDFYLVAGLSEAAGDKLYNSAFLIGPEGLVGRHRKIHLSKFETPFDAGETLEVFTIGGVRIGINICYDIWSPEASRILMRQGAQILCCPANFGGPWTLDIARVRAMENKVFHILANRIGAEPLGQETAHFRGESQIVDGLGNILVRADDRAGLRTVEIDPDEAADKSTLMSRDITAEAARYTIGFQSPKKIPQEAR